MPGRASNGEAVRVAAELTPTHSWPEFDVRVIARSSSDSQSHLISSLRVNTEVQRSKGSGITPNTFPSGRELSVGGLIRRCLSRWQFRIYVHEVPWSLGLN